jgi:hypothetical protein
MCKYTKIYDGFRRIMWQAGTLFSYFFDNYMIRFFVSGISDPRFIIYTFQMPILVHEAICISVWREKVLPLLLKMKPEPKSVFVPYMVVSIELPV